MPLRASSSPSQLSGSLYRLVNEPMFPPKSCDNFPPKVRCSEGLDAFRIFSNNCADHPISYLNTPIKTESESIEVILRRRQILFAKFEVSMENTRLPKCVMFGEFCRERGLREGAGKNGGWSVSWTTSELSVSTPTCG